MTSPAPKAPGPLLYVCVMLRTMPKPRGSEHISLTETAALVVKALTKIPGVKMIAPGEIRVAKGARGGQRYVTASYTTGGMELLISGQSIQKVAVHTTRNATTIFSELQQEKLLKNFVFSERERKPGV